MWDGVKGYWPFASQAAQPVQDGGSDLEQSPPGEMRYAESPHSGSFEMGHVDGAEAEGEDDDCGDEDGVAGDEGADEAVEADSTTSEAPKPKRQRISRSTVVYRICFCGCGALAGGRRLSKVGVTRHKQLNALGLSRSAQSKLARSLSQGDETIQCIDDPKLKDRVRALFMAPEHFQGHRDTGARKSKHSHIPTHLFDDGVFKPVKSMATPATARKSPVEKQIETISGSRSRDIRESAEVVSAYIARLELRVLGAEEEAEALKAEVASFGDLPQWKQRHSGCISPCLRFDVIKDDVRTCRTLFGFGGDFISALVRHVDNFGALSKSPRYNAENFRALLREDSVAAAAAGASSVRLSTVQAKPSGQLLGRATSIFDDVAITLFILHTDSTHDHAAWLFGIGSMTVSEIFATVITILDKFFHTEFGPMDFERARLTTPLSLAEKTGHSAPAFALDALEGRHQAPRAGILNAMLFSQYKNGTTVKYLVLVSLGGFVVYVSDAFVGSTSDNNVVIAVVPDMMKYIPRGSTIFVDKGFLLAQLIETATTYGITFRVPPRKESGVKQYEAHNTDTTAKIANVRIVVENVIGRTSGLFPYVKAVQPGVKSDLLSSSTRVCFFLTNFLPPLTSGGSVNIHARTSDEKRVARMKKPANDNPANFNVTMEAADFRDSDDDDDDDE